MSKEKKYKPKTVAIEIGDVGFDPLVQAKIEGIPEEQSALKKAILGFGGPIFEKFENIYKSSEALTGNDRTELKNMLADEIRLAGKDPKSYEDPKTETGGHSSELSSHYSFMYQALHNNHSIDDIVNGYDGKTGLNDRFQKQFERDFIHGTKNEIIHTNGEREDLNATINTEQKFKLSYSEDLEEAKKTEIKDQIAKNFVKEFREKVEVTDEQMQYLIANHNQRANLACGTFFAIKKKGELPTLFNITGQETILDVEEVNDKPVLKGVTYRCTAGHRVKDENGDDTKEIAGDAKISLYVDLSGLKANRQEGEKEFLPLPSKKVTQILTYEPLSQEFEYQLPECLQHRTLDKVMAQAIATPDRDKVSFIANTKAGKKELNKVLENAIATQDRNKATFIQQNFEDKLSKKNKAFVGLYLDDNSENHDKYLADLVNSYKGSKDNKKAAAQCSRDIFEYFEHQNKSLDNKLSEDTLDKFFRCRNAVQNYFEGNEDIENVVNHIKVMEVAIQVNKRSKEKEQETSRSSMDLTDNEADTDTPPLSPRSSSSLSNGDLGGAFPKNVSKGPRRFTDAIRKLQEKKNEVSTDNNAHLPNLKLPDTHGHGIR
jgi:hypothetical protein